MADKDFTLEDIRKVVHIELGDIRQVVREELGDIRLIVREEVDKSFDAKFKPAFDSAFVAAFKPAFDEAFEPWAVAIQQDFNRIHEKLGEHDERFDRLESDVDSLRSDMLVVKTQIKGIKRIVGQHSKEIIELRAKVA